MVSAVLTVALLAGAVVVLAGDQDDGDGGVGAPTAATEPTPVAAAAPTAPIIVTISAPGERRLVADRSFDVHVAAVGERSITAVELWDGGALVDTVSPEVSGPTATAAFALAPNPGPHALVARATDESGVVGQSSPHRFDAIASPDAGADVTSPTSTPPSTTTDPDGAAAAQLAPGEMAAARPDDAAPSVRAGTEACTVDVAPPTAGPWTSLQVSPPGSSAFVPLPERTGGSGLAVPGGVLLVQAVGPDGPSPLAAITIPDRCSDDRWDGDARILRGRLHTNADADRAYAYLRVDGGGWQRVPPGEQASVPVGAGGTFDLSTHLPSLSGRSLELRAWGRRGGELVALGTGRLELDAGAGATGGAVGLAGFGSEMVGGLDAIAGSLLRTDLDWVVAHATDGGTAEIQVAHPEILAREGTLVYDENGELGPETDFGKGDPVLDMRWEANDPSVTHGILQVSAVPPPPGPDLDYPGLLAYLPVAGVSGEHAVDVERAWLGHGPTVMQASPIPYEQLSPAGLGLVLTPAGLPVSAAEQPDEPKMKLPPSVIAELAALVHPTTLYVRVVPMAGTQPVDHVSNLVTFAIGPEHGMKLPPPAPLPGLAAPQVVGAEVGFHPPGPPNGKYARCVRVIANPHGDQNLAPVGFLQPSYDAFEPAGVGDTVCAAYNPPEEHWYDVIVDAINFVAAVWDDVAGFVNDLKDDLVELAAMFGCKQWAEVHWAALPASAKDALKDQGIDGPMDLCTTMIGAAVDAYLMTNGIPPTMPTSDEVATGLKGDVAAFVASKVAAACPPPTDVACEEQAKKYVQKIIDEVQGEVSDSTKAQATAGDWNLFLADDIVVVPEPAGQFRPAVFEVTLQVTPSPVDTSCGWVGSVTGNHPAWTYRKPMNAQDFKKVTEPISGPVMVANNGSVHIPAGATTATGVVVLPQLDRTWHPIPADTWNSDPFWWAWFQPAASLTMSVTGCGLPADGMTTTIAGGMKPAKSPVEVPVP